MALVLANRVQETGTANTTVSFTLTGALTGFQTFATIGNTNTTYYAATDAVGNWEVGLGTYSTTGPTLTRTTVYASSNSGSAVTFSGTVNIFVTYPSGRSVNLDASGNVSALGTIASGTWQGTTVGVSYGGTGVTTSSGASSVVLRDANQNVTANNFLAGYSAVTAAAGTTVLTNASAYYQRLSGSTTQTFQLPDATTCVLGQAFVFDNDSSGTLTVVDNASATVDTIPSGGYGYIFAESISTSAGSWGKYALLPANYDFNTTSANFGAAVITNATYQGNTIASGYGGTGLTTFTGANNALYSTSSSVLAAGTLPVAAGGTGITTTPTNGQIPIGNGTNYTAATLTAGAGVGITNASGSITVAATGSTINSQSGAYVLVAGDAGKTISITTGGVTIPNSVMSAGNIVSIYNNSGSSQTITQGTGVTLQWAGQTSSTTGNRTLGLYGMATVVFITASNAVITGSGLT